MGYLHDGVCKPIEAYEHTQIAKPTAGGLPSPTLGESGAQCDNALDDDNDGFVNDGCPAVGLPELPVVQCADAVDDDGDGKVNDGCLLVPGVDIVLSFHVERTEDYGPLVARGTLLDDTPIAIATLRATYMNELGSARGFRRVNDPTFMANGYDVVPPGHGRRRRLHLQLVLHRPARHRVPALVQVSAAGAGRRPVSPDARATGSSTGRASSRSPRSRSI
mgnify:CR=1 FL=1